MRARRFEAIGAVTLVLACSSAAQAQPARPLRYDLRIDLPVTLTLGAGWIASELLKGSLAPAACRWCDRNADGSEALNPVDAAVRNALVWPNTGAADLASSLSAFVAAPLAVLGLDLLAAANDDRLAEAPVDALIIAEAAVAASALNQIVKFAAGRERPFVHFLPSGAPSPAPADDNLSFYSGHTSLAFSLAVAGGTVASMRGYRGAPWVWAAGLALATLTGYLRMAADRHYFTDVLVGAAIGSAMGFVIPFVLHPAEPPGASR